MTFDARSKERLEALGRTLPRPLPPPDPGRSGQSQQPTSSGAGGSEKRLHRLENEEDPAALFHALMQASPDGQVPPHLLERLRALEGSVEGSTRKQGKQAAFRAREDSRPREPRRREAPTGADDLYTAFAQLLLEEDD